MGDEPMAQPQAQAWAWARALVWAWARARAQGASACVDEGLCAGASGDGRVPS